MQIKLLVAAIALTLPGCSNSPSFKPEVEKIATSGKDSVMLVNFGYRITTLKAVAEMKKYGLRPASSAECLLHRVTIEKIQSQRFPYATICLGKRSEREVRSIAGDESWVFLYDASSLSWFYSTRFLAVRVVP